MKYIELMVNESMTLSQDNTGIYVTVSTDGYYECVVSDTASNISISFIKNNIPTIPNIHINNRLTNTYEVYLQRGYYLLPFKFKNDKFKEFTIKLSLLNR